MPTFTNLDIAVIGAGAAGLAAVNYLLAEGHRVTLFERRSSPGGVWNAEAGQIGRSTWADPVYDALQTNVPRALMTFSDQPWNEKTSLFPPHKDVKQYLQASSDRSTAVRYVRCPAPGCGRRLSLLYDTSVDTLRKCQRNGLKTWRIDSTTLGGAKQTHWIDNVVAATGSYDKPNIPDEETGRTVWADTYPGSVILAHHYKNPQPFINKNVVIVGYGPSGWDISVQLKGIAKSITVSTRSRPLRDYSSNEVVGVGKIRQYCPADRAIDFEDGKTAKEVDYVIYCTGYKYNFPFIVKNVAGVEMFPNGQRVEKLFKHIFYVPDTTLAFIGLPRMTAAFTIAEAQSALVARVWSGRIELPAKRDMSQFCRTLPDDTKAKMALCEAYHALAPSLDKEYINFLAAETLTAAPMPDGFTSKQPPYWCHCFDSARSQAGDLRSAHMLKGEQRHVFYEWESLGFKLQNPCNSYHQNHIPKGCVACYI